MMARLHSGVLRTVVACLALLILLVDGDAWAQARPAAALRLAQVVPRGHDINLYAIVQDEDGTPSWPLSPGLEALVGATRVPVTDVTDKVQASDGIAVVFLVDISASLKKAQFDFIRQSLLHWTSALGQNDRAAVVTFGSKVNIVQDFTANKELLSDVIGGLEARDQNTLLYQGVVQAIDLSRRLDQRPLRRAIVVLTDGLDDQQGGASRQEVLDKLALDPTPIYGIGAAAKNNAKVDQALKDFSAVTRVSGGDFRRAEIGSRSIDQAYSDLRNIIDQTRHLAAKCESCIADGSTVVIKLFVSTQTESLPSQNVTVRMVNETGKVSPPPPPPPPSQPILLPAPQPDPWWQVILKIVIDGKAPLLWSIGLALLAIAGIAGTLAVLRRRRTEPQAPPVSARPPVSQPSARTTSGSVSVPVPLVSSNLDKRRLRLYPLGQNDLTPIDVLFEAKLAVGRSPDSDICIGNDGQVSGKHCTVSPDGKFILVQDAESRNGTRVNGVPINGSMHAEPDSILGIGRTELRIRLLPAGAR